MELKYIGAVLILGGCGAAGLRMAAAYNRQISELRSMIKVLDWMMWELEYRMPPLPELISKAAETCPGPVCVVLKDLSEELCQRVLPDSGACMKTVLSKRSDLSTGTIAFLEELGSILGTFDLPGQVQGLQSIKKRCLESCHNLEEVRSQRIQSYQTLALCAGAALAILLL